ncbi:MAG: phosphate acetyltransferase, partial [Nitrospiraceae bacterium]|nr:phosphate acetyltransferase [Nitrospiraceae bacterium]
MEALLKNAIEKAKSNPKRIVYPESKERRTLIAIERLTKEKLVYPILIGNEEDIKNEFRNLGLNPDYNLITIIDTDNPKSTDLNQLLEHLYQLRKEKGLTRDQAKDLIYNEPIYLGTMLVKDNLADGLISGAIHSTAHTIRPALQIIKPKPGIKRVSSYFIISEDKRLFLFADCAININPTAEELAEIAELTAESMKSYGYKPKVAMLSFSTKGSAHHPLIDKVKQATEIVKSHNPDFIIDGELQLDAAVVPEVAKIKCSNSAIQGDANVLIFPDLQSGNIGYKIAQRFGKARAIGP